jgi:replicative DNA helicase
MELSQPIHRLKRRARLLSRSEGIPLHAALDRIAREQGFRTWSLMVARAPAHVTRSAILSELSPGDLVLLAGRPGQGKTLLSLELAAEAVKAGRSAVFFTLAYTTAEVWRCLTELGEDPRTFRTRLRIDTSDDISGAHIIRTLDTAAPGTVVIVDYLQLLDQNRQTPSLSEQVASLAAFARERGLIIVCLSQIQRSFDGAGKRVPDLGDVRLPNPLDLSVFSKACFVHDGRVAFGHMTRGQ